MEQKGKGIRRPQVNCDAQVSSLLVSFLSSAGKVSMPLYHHYLTLTKEIHGVNAF